MRRAGIAIGLVAWLAACGGGEPPRAPEGPVLRPVTPPLLPPSSPTSAEPAPVVEGDTTTASFHGMEIIVRRRKGAEFTAAELVIRGGVRNWTKEHAGIEGLALGVAAHGGTRALPKEPFSRKLARLGATIEATPAYDFSTLRVKVPADSWDDTFPLLADVFLTPAMPPSEIALAKEQKLSTIRHEMENGDGRLARLMTRALYAGHPYEAGMSTLESVGGLTEAEITAHAAKLRETGRLFLVVVGDVDASHVVEQVARAFADVPRGDYVETKLPPLHYATGNVATDTFKLPTNYIRTAFIAPGWLDPDYAAMRLATRVLSERVWDEVRSKRNLSYAPSAFLDSSSTIPVGGLYVSAVDPNTTMKVMMGEAKRLQEQPVPDAELAGIRAVCITRDARDRETTDGLARALAEAEGYAGDWHFADTLLGRLKAASAADVQAAAKKWMTAYQTAIVGDPKKLDPAVVLAK